MLYFPHSQIEEILQSNIDRQSYGIKRALSAIRAGGEREVGSVFWWSGGLVV